MSLKVVKTNGYGLVKVSDLTIPDECRLPIPGIKGESAYLRLRARDSKGESGIESDYISFDYSTKYLRLRGPVERGWRFDGLAGVLGGWAKHRVFYLVMLVRRKP